MPVEMKIMGRTEEISIEIQRVEEKGKRLKRGSDKELFKKDAVVS